MPNQKCVVRSPQGDAGSIQLARALKEHTNEKLVEVDIGYNEIKDEGACALAQVRRPTCDEGACCTDALQASLCAAPAGAMMPGHTTGNTEHVCTDRVACCRL
jgi:hypothetical protein